MFADKKASTRNTSGFALLLTVLVSAPHLACNGSSGTATGTGGRASTGGATSSGGGTSTGGATGKGGATGSGGGVGSGGIGSTGGTTGGTTGGGTGGTAGARTGGTAGGGTGGTVGGGTGGTAGARTGGTAGGGTGGTTGGGTGGTAGARTGGTAGGGTGGTAGAGTGGTAGAGSGGTAAGGTGGAANGAAIYVSPSGDDTGDGSIDHPLKTLTAARDMADKRKANNTPVTVYLRAGTYYLGAPVEFGPSNSGTSTAPIVYTAYSGEKPVISGAIKVTSTWSTSSGSIQVATIDKDLKVDQLFLNGKRQVLARYPNYDATKILDGHASDCISSTRVGKWADPTEGPGYIRAEHDSQWGGNDFIITGKSGTTVTYKWVGDNNRGSGMHSTYRMVENIFEELDAAGEWYYKKSTGLLYFWPPSGTDLSTATIELASQDELLRVVGTSATATVQYLTFQGLTFTHTYRTLFSKTYEPLLQGDWAIARAGTLFMNNAENIRVDSCLFDQVGGNGVFMSGHNRNNAVVNSDFEDAGASCVAMVGLQSAVRCAATAYGQAPSCSDKTPGPKTDDYPASNLVENNMMNNFGRFEKQVAGVHMSMTSKNTVRHNTIHTMPRAGINFNDGCWGGHLIEGNWVYGAVLETGDHGPFNAWGRDRNLIFQSDPNATKYDAVDTTTIQNNRFEVASGMFGVDNDDQSSNYLIQNNLLIGGGLKLQWNRYNTYQNNILVNGAVADIHNPWSQSNHIFTHNIIVGSCTYELYSTDPGAIKTAILTLDSNLLYNNGSDPKICTWPGKGNSSVTWSQWKAAGLDASSVVADPMFTSPTTGDYTVKDASPALTVGFKNFPMTGFGVTSGPQGPTAAMPESPKN
jgi:hypothetical protein